MSLRKVKYLFLILIVSNGWTQQIRWSSVTGGNYNDESYASVQTSDNGYAVLGSTYSFGSGDYDFFFIRLNENGDTLWTKTFGGQYADYGRSLINTPDKGFLLVGTSKSGGFGMGDIYVIKIDSLGELIWEKSYGGAEADEGNSVIMTTELGYLICGTTLSYGLNGDMALLKIDSLGVAKWIKTYGGTEGDSGFDVKLTGDGGYIAVGGTGSFGLGYSSVYVVRTNAAGGTLWTNAYGGDKSDFGYSVSPTYDGGFVFAGTTESFGEGYKDAYLIKTDADGLLLWQKTYGGFKDERAYSVFATSDGGYVLGGITHSFGAGKVDMYILKTDENGDTTWTRTIGGPKSDYCYNVIQNYNFDFILSGSSYSYSSGGADAYIVNLTTDMVTAVGDEVPNLNPSDFNLRQNYPNPFNATTNIEYSLSKAVPVSLVVYNILGQKIKEWNFERQSKGDYIIQWDGTNNYNQKVASGVYLYRIVTDNFVETKKMVLLE